MGRVGETLIPGLERKSPGAGEEPRVCSSWHRAPDPVLAADRRNCMVVLLRAQNMELVIGWNGGQQQKDESQACLCHLHCIAAVQEPEVPNFPQMAGLISAAEMMLKALHLCEGCACVGLTPLMVPHCWPSKDQRPGSCSVILPSSRVIETNQMETHTRWHPLFLQILPAAYTLLQTCGILRMRGLTIQCIELASESAKGGCNRKSSTLFG